jgi:hypothetical protein
VSIGGSGVVGNALRGNRIFANDGPGIDLARDGRTPNDDAPAGSEDDDDGPNRLQNFPVISSTSYNASTNEITVTYEVPSNPNASGSGASTYDLTVDFYRAETSTQDAEGEAYLGSDTYSQSDFSAGTKTITFTPDAPVTTSDQLVATATDANGNTSEFSGASSPLPVELARFDAQIDETPGTDGSGTGEGAAVRLAWQTASETQNAGFRVERQRAGASSETSAGRWQQVGYVESKAPGGTSTEALRYRYRDREVPFAADTVRYRLTQVDTDGSTSQSEVVEVALGAVDQLTLKKPYPNPARGDVTVKLAVPPAKSGSATLWLYNALGQEVQAVPVGERGRQRVEVPTDGLASGVYFLRLTAGEATKTRRVTVVR